MAMTIILLKVKKMINIGNDYSPQPGDVVVRNKSVLGFIDHYGLYVGNGSIIDNHPDIGVSAISLNSFLSGRKLERIARFQGNLYSRNLVVRKAQSMLGLNYHLTKFNCEHFVNEAWGVGRKSQQVVAVGVLFLFSLAMWGLSKSN
jgi:uncharacterized protein YycO